MILVMGLEGIPAELEAALPAVHRDLEAYDSSYALKCHPKAEQSRVCHGTTENE